MKIKAEQVVAFLTEIDKGESLVHTIYDDDSWWTWKGIDYWDSCDDTAQEQIRVFRYADSCDFLDEEFSPYAVKFVISEKGRSWLAKNRQG